jgi:tetratricopeptide (TPR) repeat protein
MSEPLKAHISEDSRLSPVATLLRLALAGLLFTLIGGCASMVVDPLIDPLNHSLQRQTDLNLVREGTPTLLLMLDGLIADNPDNRKLLLTATQAYSSYASTLYELGEIERAAALSIKARDYGLALLCLTPSMQGNIQTPLENFSGCLVSFRKTNVPSLFWAGYGWATWIRLQNGAPAALADLPKVEQIMLRVVDLDETYYYGAAHIFLGYYYGSRPEILGGKLEKSRSHFERALQIADRNFLLAQVSFAESYARLSFNRELFENLLTEVLNHPEKDDSDLATSNELAKSRARTLLAQIDDLF